MTRGNIRKEIILLCICSVCQKHLPKKSFYKSKLTSIFLAWGNFNNLSSHYWAITSAFWVSHSSSKVHLVGQQGHSRRCSLCWSCPHSHLVVVLIFEPSLDQVSLYQCYVSSNTIQSSPNLRINRPQKSLFRNLQQDLRFTLQYDAASIQGVVQLQKISRTLFVVSGKSIISNPTQNIFMFEKFIAEAKRLLPYCLFTSLLINFSRIFSKKTNSSGDNNIYLRNGTGNVWNKAASHLSGDQIFVLTDYSHQSVSSK